MNRLLFLFLLLGVHYVRAQAPVLSPLQVVENFVSPHGFPAKKQHVSGELMGERKSDTTLGQRLPARVQRKVRLIAQDTTFACVAVCLQDTANSIDYYFYLRKKEVWSMYAIRTLSGIGVVKGALKSLDSIPPDARGKKYAATHSHTWEFERANTVLFLGSDSTLKAHYLQNRAAFAKLSHSFLQPPYKNQSDSVLATAFGQKKIRKQTDKLLIRSVVTDKNSTGSLLFLLGGTGDNRAGYLYQPDRTKVPAISPRSYILIEELGNGWYLIKTT
ncbi:MAG: hypothetical protein MUC87_12920 [Bacteroidia bacterium]|nr:hypothetical protein [Bacteroidia bacterium]